MNKTTEKIPTWSLGYIINGDMTGLTDEEIRMIDEWLSKWKVQIVSPLTDEEGNTQPYFSFSDFQPKWRTATYFTRMTTSKI